MAVWMETIGWWLGWCVLGVWAVGLTWWATGGARRLDKRAWQMPDEMAQPTNAATWQKK